MKKKRCESCGHVHYRKKKDWLSCEVKNCKCAALIVGGKAIR